MKKAISVFSLLLILALLFTGCTPEESKPEEDGKQNQPPIINYEPKDESGPDGFQFHYSPAE